MTIARESTAANIKPLTGAIIRRHTAGAAIDAGAVVSLQDDGFVDMSDMGSAADEAIGIAIQAATVAESDVIDVVCFGPVNCLSGASPGATVYTHSTAGQPTETDASDKTAVGYAESTTVLFVHPERLVV